MGIMQKPAISCVTFARHYGGLSLNFMRGGEERDRRREPLLISKLVTPLLLDWNVNDINK